VESDHVVDPTAQCLSSLPGLRLRFGAADQAHQHDRDRRTTAASFEQFFVVIGQELAQGIEFVCSDMWQPYPDLIARHCTRALNILDRFHVVAKLNLALDQIRASEAKRMAREGYEPVLKKTRWCILKRPENLTDKRRMTLRELLRYNLRSVRA
jgi:transposase